QRLSCQYEEREVKIKIAAAEPQKKMTTTADGKIKVVINKKSGVKVPKAVYETKIEVVKESKKAYRDSSRQRDERRFSEPRRERNNSFASNSDFGGGTMADFFRLSQQKDEERKNKKRK
ncbi:MAG: hypothetical protein J6R23_03880, partial [Spirochaetales bacterium]|nr:hypothetical protein [Spirochaetales bacterium]